MWEVLPEGAEKTWMSCWVLVGPDADADADADTGSGCVTDGGAGGASTGGSLVVVASDDTVSAVVCWFSPSWAALIVGRDGETAL